MQIEHAQRPNSTNKCQQSSNVLSKMREIICKARSDRPGCSNSPTFQPLNYTSAALKTAVASASFVREDCTIRCYHAKPSTCIYKNPQTCQAHFNGVQCRNQDEARVSKLIHGTMVMLASQKFYLIGSGNPTTLCFTA